MKERIGRAIKGFGIAIYRMVEKTIIYKIVRETIKRFGRMMYILVVGIFLFLLMMLYTYLRFLVLIKRIRIHHWERFPADLEKEPRIFIINHPTYIEPPVAYLPFLWILYKAVFKAGIRGVEDIISLRVLTFENLEEEIESRFKEVERAFPKTPVSDKYLFVPHILLLRNVAVVPIFGGEEKEKRRSRVEAMSKFIKMVREERVSVISLRKEQGHAMFPKKI